MVLQVIGSDAARAGAAVETGRSAPLGSRRAWCGSKPLISRSTCGTELYQASTIGAHAEQASSLMRAAGPVRRYRRHGLHGDRQ